jgi:dipeptidyl aminopeptidase/acylaminoacyl peptidase
VPHLACTVANRESGTNISCFVEQAFLRSFALSLVHSLLQACYSVRSTSDYKLAMATSLTSLTAEALVDLEKPKDVRLSPDGSRVVYSTSPMGRRGKHTISSIWIADVGKEFSARQITSGLTNDVMPQWSLNGESIAFISDRAEPGESSAIYFLSMKGGEAYPMTSPRNHKTITSFGWSPDGKYIAYLSPDEKAANIKARERNGDDTKVYGENWEFNRLRCLHPLTRIITTLSRDGRHVDQFTWSGDSSDIAFVLHATPEVSSAGYSGVEFEKVNLSSGQISGLGSFAGPIQRLLWYETHLLFLAGVEKTKSNTSQVIYDLPINGQVSARRAPDQKRSFGHDTCVLDLRLTVRGPIVLTAQGRKESIEDLEKQVWYSTTSGIFPTWDFAFVARRSVLIVGAGSTGFPPDIRSYFLDRDAFCQLSHHGKALVELNLGKFIWTKCTSRDGKHLDGILMTPRDFIPPCPVVVLIHGGPYDRIGPALNAISYHLASWLLSAGYQVLCPNYRGNSSYGEEFARHARAGMGTKDYEDVIDFVKAMISDGTIDKANVGIGGWSQGGFLSYLAVTRPDFQFKAAVCGAGVSDWDMLTMSTNAPWMEAELAGRAPWESDALDTRARHGSAIWHMEDVKTPILILHGEEDELVPISQAIAFHRGCMHHRVPCQMAIYPREKHIIEERQHLLDMLKRIRGFYDLHLKQEF